MRILVVCQHYWPEPFNVSEVCEELAARGHEVTVLTGLPNVPEGSVRPDYRRGRNRRQRRNGVSIARVPIVARGADLRGLNKLRRVLNYASFEVSGLLGSKSLKQDFDRVLVFQYSPVLMAVPGIRYAEAHGIPSLLYCFDLWPEDLLTGGMRRSGVPYRCMRAVSRDIYSRASGVAVTSPGFATYFREQLGLCDLDTTYLPQFAEGQFEAIGGEPHEEGEELHLLFAGNVGGNQSVETIVLAAAMLPEDLPIVIDIVGSGSRLETCRKLAHDVGADKVLFHGRHPLGEMPAFYRRADATVITLSSRYGESLVPEYTIPRKLQSYLAVGRPVVCAAAGETGRVVEASGGGIAAAPDDPEALCAAMVELACMGGPRRAAMGARAKRYYDEHFSRARFFVDLESTLEDMEVQAR